MIAIAEAIARIVCIIIGLCGLGMACLWAWEYIRESLERDGE